MKRWILFLMLILVLACPPVGWGADKKVTALPLDNAPTSDDLLMTVDSPSGSPASKKTTVGDVINSGGLIKNLAGDVAASGGGTSSTATIQPQTVTETKLLLSDTTTGNATTAKHGFLPKLNNSATTFLDGTGAWTTPAGTGGEGGGSGDFVGPSSSVDGEIMLFNGVTGKLGKRATSSGILKATSGVIGTASAGTDYLAPTGSGAGLSGIAKTTGSYTAGNLLTTDASGNHVDAGVAAPTGPYGDVNGSGASVSDFLPVYSGTSGKAIVTSGVSVSGAGKDSLTVPATVTADSFVSTGTDDTKIGDVSGGNYIEIDYTTGMLSKAGTGGINWNTINPITTAGVNWTQWTDDTSVNWAEVTKLSTGGGSAEWTETTPTIAAGTGAGTSPTISIEGSDADGWITLVTGTSPATSATIATITFDSTFTHIPVPVLNPANSAASLLYGVQAPYFDYASGSTTTAVLKSNTTALTAATTYIWAYHNLGH